MYKYGMPYDTEHLEKLMQWLAKNNYELAGDIIDVCLLDTTFYKQETGVDFCMLQAPVNLKKINKNFFKNLLTVLLHHNLLSNCEVTLNKKSGGYFYD